MARLITVRLAALSEAATAGTTHMPSLGDELEAPMITPRLAEGSSVSVSLVDRADSVDHPAHRRQIEGLGEHRPTRWAGRQRQRRLQQPGPAAACTAPSTPPPPRSLVFAAVTTASTAFRCQPDGR